MGSTNNLERRLQEHNDGLVSSTKPYRPWRLAVYEAYSSEADAREHEQKLKAHGNAIKELKRRARGSLKNGAGFTLIELLVVIAIIGILSAVAVVNLSSTRTKAKLTQMESTMNNLLKGASVCLQSNVQLNCAAPAGMDACNGAASGPLGKPDATSAICLNDSPAVGTWPDLAKDTRNPWIYKFLANSNSDSATFTFSACEPSSTTFPLPTTCLSGGKTITCTETGCVTSTTP